MALNTDFIVKMPVSQKLLILGALIALMVLGYWFFVDNKMNAQLKALREGDPANPSADNVASLEQELEKLKWVERDKQNLEQQLEEKKQQLRAIESKLPSEAEMERLLLDLSQQMKAGGLVAKDIKPQPHKDAGLYMEVPIQLKLTGGYKYVMTFFSKVAEMDRIINFGGISIALAPEAKGAKTSDVEVNCTATTYRLKQQ
jgi:type IV pilus assembly protein PilO